MRALKRLIKKVLMLKPSVWLWLRTGIRRLTGRDEAELALLRFLVPPGRAALDIGANNGVYTQALLRLTDKVIAFEPNPRYVDELRRFFGDRIRLVAAALSDCSGSVDLVLPRPSGPEDLSALATIEGANPLASEIPCERLRVAAMHLDELGLGDVGFIKIDVEGHEEAVIAGAEQTLLRCQPNLLIEAEERHRPGAIEKLTRRLEKLGYRGYFLEGGVLVPASAFDAAVHQPYAAVERLWWGSTSGYCNNFVFLPMRAAAAQETSPVARIVRTRCVPQDRKMVSAE